MGVVRPNLFGAYNLTFIKRAQIIKLSLKKILFRNQHCIANFLGPKILYLVLSLWNYSSTLLHPHPSYTDKNVSNKTRQNGGI